jgi:hypothetical protein
VHPPVALCLRRALTLTVDLDQPTRTRLRENQLHRRRLVERETERRADRGAPVVAWDLGRSARLAPARVRLLQVAEQRVGGEGTRNVGLVAGVLADAVGATATV